MGTTQRVPGGVFPPGPANHPNPILIIDSLLLIPGRGGGIGLRWGVGGAPGCPPFGRATGATPSKPAGARWVVPMRSVRTQKGTVGPRGLPPLAPLAGVGADFKTVSWGGPNDGSAGPLPGLAGPEGPMGPRIAAYAAFNALLLSTTNADDAIFFATVLKQLKQREVIEP